MILLNMTKKTAVEQGVAPAVKKPRAVRPSATRVTSARHSKLAAFSDPVVIESPVSIESPVAMNTPQENPNEAIAKIAYGYWEARGDQGGNSADDWFRAEFEYRQRLAAL